MYERIKIKPITYYDKNKKMHYSDQAEIETM